MSRGARCPRGPTASARHGAPRANARTRARRCRRRRPMTTAANAVAIAAEARIDERRERRRPQRPAREGRQHRDERAGRRNVTTKTIDASTTERTPLTGDRARIIASVCFAMTCPPVSCEPHARDAPSGRASSAASASRREARRRPRLERATARLDRREPRAPFLRRRTRRRGSPCAGRDLDRVLPRDHREPQRVARELLGDLRAPGASRSARVSRRRFSHPFFGDRPRERARARRARQTAMPRSDRAPRRTSRGAGTASITCAIDSHAPKRVRRLVRARSTSAGSSPRTSTGATSPPPNTCVTRASVSASARLRKELVRSVDSLRRVTSDRREHRR